MRKNERGGAKGPEQAKREDGAAQRKDAYKRTEAKQNSQRTGPHLKGVEKPPQQESHKRGAKKHRGQTRKGKEKKNKNE